MTKSLSAFLISALLSLGLLAGCGDSESSDEATTVDGDGYAYTAPAGWEDVSGDGDKISEALGDAGADVTAEDVGAAYDSVVVSDDESNDFRTNFNVLTQEGIPAQLDSEGYAAENSRVLGNPTLAAQVLPDGLEIDYDGSPAEEVTLGGEQAFALEYGASTPDNELEIRQILLVRDGTAYVGTLTAAVDSFDEGTGDLDEIVESWEFE